MKQYIATVYVVGGYYYIGPDSDLKSIINAAKEDIGKGKGEEQVEQVYVAPFDEETSMPDSDADPLWMWNREVANTVSKSKSSHSSAKRKKKSSQSEYPNRIAGMRL